MQMAAGAGVSLRTWNSLDLLSCLRTFKVLCVWLPYFCFQSPLGECCKHLSALAKPGLSYQCSPVQVSHERGFTGTGLSDLQGYEIKQSHSHSHSQCFFLSLSFAYTRSSISLSLTHTNIHRVSGTYTLYLSNTFTRTHRYTTERRSRMKASTPESIMAIRWLQSYNQRFKVEFRGRETASIVFLRAGDRYTSKCPGMTESGRNTKQRHRSSGNIAIWRTRTFWQQKHSGETNRTLRDGKHCGGANMVIQYGKQNTTKYHVGN